MALQYHLAQVNIGKILAPMDSQIMSEFKNNLDRINALAEASEGFIWRLIYLSNGILSNMHQPSGSETVKLVQLPSSVCTSRRPPCALMIS